MRPQSAVLGLQSTALGPHYMQLDDIPVLSLSSWELQRMRIRRAPWRCSCLVCLQTWTREHPTIPKTTLLRHHNCLASHVPCGYTSPRQRSAGDPQGWSAGGAVQWHLMWS
jgi:hypothetical protein